MDIGSEAEYPRRTSMANGMQAVVLLCEMIKNNFGMSARWLIANWESDGMFYFGNNSSIPRWNPRPDFYYIYYLQRFVGDHALSTTFVGSSKDILAYATRFSSGHVNAVLINKGTADQVVRLALADYVVGERFYIYSLTGIDDSQWPQAVVVNDEGPTGQAWGPLDGLEDIPARAYPVGDMIKFDSPARSVQYILLEPGNNFVAVKDQSPSDIVTDFALRQNYPNPFNARTMIYYSFLQTSIITLKVYDVNGCELATLVRNEKKAAGNHDIVFDAGNLPSGVYFYRLSMKNFALTKKALLIK